MGFEDVYANVSSTSYVAGYYDEVNDEYADVLQDLLPTGQAWNYADGSEEHSLLRALGYPLKRVVLRGLDLLREFHPDTMFELLSDWERVLGLPGDNPSPPSTLAERRAAVLARFLGYGDPTPAFYEEIAESLGYTDPEVISVSFSPFVAGSTAGSSLYGANWAFAWYLNVDSSDSDDMLEWFIEDNLALSHTLPLVSYIPVFTDRSNPSNVALYGICYGDDKWVAVGENSGGDAYIVTSSDGTTWTERTNPKNVRLRSVAWNGSLFVAVGDTNGTTSYIVTSPDGITWTERTAIAAKTNWLYGVCWGSGQWVAAGDADADSFIITSPDGITWTEQSTPTTTNLFGVAYDGSNLYVAVGDSTGAGACLLTSPDAQTWTSRANPQNIELNSVAHDQDQTWVAVGGNVGGDAYIITSSNGLTWTEVSNSKNIDLNAVAYDIFARVWVAVGDADGTDAYILASRDASTWEELENTQNKNLYGISSGGMNKWISVGVNDGTDAYMLGFIKE